MNFLLIQLFAVSLIGGMQSVLNSLPASGPGDNELAIVKCEDFEVTGDGAYGSWSSAEWVTIQPRSNSGDSYRTRAKVMYSQTGLYFLFDCQDKILTTSLNGDRCFETHDVPRRWRPSRSSVVFNAGCICIR